MGSDREQGGCSRMPRNASRAFLNLTSYPEGNHLRGVKRLRCGLPLCVCAPNVVQSQSLAMKKWLRRWSSKQAKLKPASSYRLPDRCSSSRPNAASRTILVNAAYPADSSVLLYEPQQHKSSSVTALGQEQDDSAFDSPHAELGRRTASVSAMSYSLDSRGSKNNAASSALSNGQVQRRRGRTQSLSGCTFEPSTTANVAQLDTASEAYSQHQPSVCDSIYRSYDSDIVELGPGARAFDKNPLLSTAPSANWLWEDSSQPQTPLQQHDSLRQHRLRSHPKPHAPKPPLARYASDPRKSEALTKSVSYAPALLSQRSQSPHPAALKEKLFVTPCAKNAQISASQSVYSRNVRISTDENVRAQPLLTVEQTNGCTGRLQACANPSFLD